MKKKILILIVLGLILSIFSVFSPKKVHAATCTTDAECEKRSDAMNTLGCYYEVKGLSAKWLCANAHSEVKACTTDAMCTPSDPTYDSSVVGCQNVMNRWQCSIIRTPGVGKETASDVSCDNGTGIKTAIGCIHVLDTSESFLTDILKWATGIGGGIAFLLILYAGFMIMTASGNPERLKAGQELLTSALSGLILLILSIFILKFIGIDILGLDKFGFGK